MFDPLPFALLVAGSALAASGALLALGATKLYSGDWREATTLTRLVRRFLGGPVLMRMGGVVWIVLGSTILCLAVARLISN